MATPHTPPPPPVPLPAPGAAGDADLDRSGKVLGIEKTGLENEALRRAARTDGLRLLLTAVGALAFLVGFFFDRYKVWEQRGADRRLAIATEFDQMHTRTTAALSKKQKNPVLLRLSVESHLGRVRDAEKAVGSAKLDPDQSKGLRAALADSRDAAERVLAEMSANTEFRQWSEAIDVEAVWQARADAIAPDAAALFGAEVAGGWDQVRQAALEAIRSEFSLIGGEDARPKAAAYERAAAEYRRKLYARLR